MVQRLTDAIVIVGMPKIISEYAKFMESMMLWTLPVNVAYLTPFLIRLAENIFQKFNHRNNHYLDYVVQYLRVAEIKIEQFSGRKVRIMPKYI